MHFGVLYCVEVGSYAIGFFVLQFGITDQKAHESAKKILLKMGEYFQIQVNMIQFYVVSILLNGRILSDSGQYDSM